MAFKVFVEDSGTGLSSQADADFLDAASVAAAAHDENATDYAVAAPSLSADYTTPEITLGPAQYRLGVSDLTTRDHGDGTTTWPRATLVVQADQTTLSLTDGATNEIFLVADLSNGPDAASYDVRDDGSTPSLPSLLVATVDTAGDSATVENDKPEIDAGSVSASESITDPEGNTFTDLSDPVRVTEDAVTFAESDVTVTNTNTEISNGSVQLSGETATTVDDFEDNDITVKASEWSGWSDETQALTTTQEPNLPGTYSGRLEANGTGQSVEATTNSSIQPGRVSFLVYVEVTTSREFDIVEVRIGTSSGNFGPRVSFDQGTNEIRLNGNQIGSGTWSSRTPYEVVFKNLDYDGGSLDVEVYNNSTGNLVASKEDDFFSLPEVSLVRLRTVSESESLVAKFDNIIVGQNIDFTSGESVIEWDSGVPADIDSWDLATFRRALDNETVTVDVEDGDGNVLFSDIGPNFDISSVSVDNNVKIRANLSRNDTTNNPTLDYAARRYTR